MIFYLIINNYQLLYIYKMKKFTQSVFLILALFCATNIMAQNNRPGPPPPPGLPQPEDDNDNNSGVPLDGGIAIFILGAAAYGIKKLREDNSK